MEKFGPPKRLNVIWIVACLGLLPLLWFRGDNLINIGDFCFPLARNLYFRFSLYCWDHSISMGYPAPGQLAAIFPYSTLGLLSEALGFSVVFFEKSMFCFWFALSGLGMYAMCRHFKFSELAALFSALFYMMNPYSLLVPWHLASGQLISGYAMTPALMALLAKAVETGRLRDSLLLVSVWFVFGTYAYMNQTVAIVHLIILVSFFFFHFRGKMSGANLAQFLLIFGGWTLLSCYWIVPFMANLAAQTASAANSSMGFISNKATFILNSSEMLDSFRLLGLWSLFAEWREGVPYYAWAKTYKLAVFMAISFIPPLLALSALAGKECRTRKHLLYFAALFAAGLLCIKGFRPPFSSLSLWISNNVPLFGTAFRASFQKWGLLLAFSFAVLVGCGLSVIREYLETMLGRVFANATVSVIFILMFFVQMFPFWNGQVIFEGGGIVPSARSKLPASYSAFYEWTKTQKQEFRIFSLPLSKNSNTIYKWEDSGYSGADFIRFFSHKPVVYANYGSYYEIPLTAAEKIETRSGAGVLYLLSMLNVRYVLIHDDINWEAIKELTWWINKDAGALKDFADGEKGLVLEKKFDCFRVYRLSDKYTTPFFYTTKSSVLVNGLAKDLPVLANKGFLDKKPILLFMANDIPSGESIPGNRLLAYREKGEWSVSGFALQNTLPDMVFRRHSPVRYEVSVSSAAGPFWLVMAETYNPNWRIYRRPEYSVEGDSGKDVVGTYPVFNVKEAAYTDSFDFRDMRFMFKKAVNVKHFVGNTYCNAWYIDPKDFGGGSFSLDVFFLPQSAVCLSLAFSLFLLIVSAVVLPLLYYHRVGRGQR